MRFQLQPTGNWKKGEKALRQSPYFTGENALPGQYLDAAHEAPREAAILALLIAALNAHLPADLMIAKPRHVRRQRGLTRTPPYSSRTTLSCPARSPAANLGLPLDVGVICRASFEIPNDPDPLIFKLSVWRAPDLKTITDTTTPQELYDTMASEAFKRFAKKYLATVFAEK